MYRGSVIDDLIETVKVAEQHLDTAQGSQLKKARANVQAYATYMNDYVRPVAQIHEVA
jgi:hypothetical protein